VTPSASDESKKDSAPNSLVDNVMAYLFREIDHIKNTTDGIKELEDSRSAAMTHLMESAASNSEKLVAVEKTVAEVKRLEVANSAKLDAVQSLALRSLMKIDRLQQLVSDESRKTGSLENILGDTENAKTPSWMGPKSIRSRVGLNGKPAAKPEWKPRNCHEIYSAGKRRNSVYTIYLQNPERAVRVFCDMRGHRGGWTVRKHYITLLYYLRGRSEIVGFRV